MPNCLPVLAMLLVLGLMPAARAASAAPSSTDTNDSSRLAALLEPLDTLSQWITRLFPHDERFVVEEIEQFKHMVDTDLTAFDGLVHQAGFRIARVSVGADMVPRVRLAMDFVRRPSEPEKGALMARITDPAGSVGTIERSIVMTLLNAAESGYAARSDGYRLTGVNIDVEVIPNVTFVLSREP